MIKFTHTTETQTDDTGEELYTLEIFTATNGSGDTARFQGTQVMPDLYSGVYSESTGVIPPFNSSHEQTEDEIRETLKRLLQIFE